MAFERKQLFLVQDLPRTALCKQNYDDSKQKSRTDRGVERMTHPSNTEISN